MLVGRLELMVVLVLFTSAVLEVVMRPLGVELAAMLADRGVDTVFGIPGVHNIELYRGIEEAGIRHVLARHEQGAGFMADGYARATGQPGVCFRDFGAGADAIS